MEDYGHNHCRLRMARRVLTQRVAGSPGCSNRGRTATGSHRTRPKLFSRPQLSTVANYLRLFCGATVCPMLPASAAAPAGATGDEHLSVGDSLRQSVPIGLSGWALGRGFVSDELTPCDSVRPVATPGMQLLVQRGGCWRLVLRVVRRPGIRGRFQWDHRHGRLRQLGNCLGLIVRPNVRVPHRHIDVGMPSEFFSFRKRRAVTEQFGDV